MCEKYKVFIVGHEGTTGLRIHERLESRADISLLSIADEKRKDMAEIAKVANDADVIFLCLPDAASKEVVEATKHLSCKVIDASTAHRTHPEWAYGFPELGESYKAKIASNRYIAVPGCHASGMIAIVKPLVEAGVVPSDYPLSVLSLTGYSGGGKSMIAEYEEAASEGEAEFCTCSFATYGDGEKMIAHQKKVNKKNALFAPRQYGLKQMHKHLPEVVHVCRLSEAPIFSPIVDDYYAGMEVTIGFHTKFLGKQVTAKNIWETLYNQYKDSKIVTVMPFDLEETNALFLSANEQAGLDGMKLYVSGNDDRVMVHALFDNLGKGASGAAVECMNIALGLEETTGLAL